MRTKAVVLSKIDKLCADMDFVGNRWSEVSKELDKKLSYVIKIPHLQNVGIKQEIVQLINETIIPVITKDAVLKVDFQHESGKKIERILCNSPVWQKTVDKSHSCPCRCLWLEVEFGKHIDTEVTGHFISKLDATKAKSMIHDPGERECANQSCGMAQIWVRERKKYVNKCTKRLARICV